MTGLHRTPLTTSQKMECVGKALAGQAGCGGIAALSRDYVFSPDGVCSRRPRPLRYVREHFEEVQSRSGVWVK